MNNKSKYQYVFSMKLAGTLMTKGFKILRINKHLEDNSKDVYVFEKSKEIQNEIDKYIKAKGENNHADSNKRSRCKAKW